MSKMDISTPNTAFENLQDFRKILMEHSHLFLWRGHTED